MTEDLVTLWADHDPEHDVTYEIVQIGESEFELRIICDEHVWLTEDSSDFHDLLDRARELRAELHPQV